MNKPFPIHVRTVTGLEEVLAEELRALGALDIQTRNRLVVCQGDLSLLYRANLWCRTAIRVLLPLTTFPARNEKAFYDGVRSLNWNRWLSPMGTLAVDANVSSSFTTHSLFIAQLTKDAVVDQFRDKTGRRPSVDREHPQLRIAISLFQDMAQVFIDSSGDSLHKRGYRRKTGGAPLNESLAAGILKLTGWDGTAPLVDPMCGAGTFAIEAGLLVKNIAPGLLRKHFGFQTWPDYNRLLYEKLLSQARKAIRKDAAPTIVGLDIDPKAVDIARENVERAGINGWLRIEQGDFFTWHKMPENAGTIVMNPPYNERLPVDNVAELFQRIGDRLKQAYGGWTAHLLSGNLDAVKYVGLRNSCRTVLYNGAIECRLLKYELRAPSPGHVFTRRVRQNDKPHPKWIEKADVFGNRLRKNLKHYSKWAAREGVTCWRVYDRDIPELPFIIDFYGDRLHFSEVQRNHDHSPLEHTSYLELMVKKAAEATHIAPENIYFKKRKPQERRGFQYTPHGTTGEFVEVRENNCRFLVNLADYLDVGLFLDHRNTRLMVKNEASGKDFLNLYAYTGSFTVFAATGGAKSTTTVDTAHTYLDWAKKNLHLNGLRGAQHHFVRSDAVQFLKRTTKEFDLIVVDPPTRSVNRSSGRVFEVQKDHVRLLRLIIENTRPGGKIFFSTNYRTFELDEADLRQGCQVHVREITMLTTPIDFERKPSHRCWLIAKTKSSTLNNLLV